MCFGKRPVEKVCFVGDVMFSFGGHCLFHESGKVSPSSIEFFVEQCSIILVFISTFLAKLIFNSVCTSGTSGRVLSSLSFLFAAGLSTELNRGTIDAFYTYFTSSFVFLAIMFLLKLTP